MTEPVDTPQLDALVEEHFVRVEGRRLDEVSDRVLDFAVRPVRFGGVLQLEDYFGIGVHAPEDRKAPAPPRGRWTASVDFGRSIGLTDADEDVAGLVSNRIYLDLDAPYPDDAWADSSPGARTSRSSTHAARASKAAARVRSTFSTTSASPTPSS